jgi:hypothetical protein
VVLVRQRLDAIVTIRGATVDPREQEVHLAGGESPVVGELAVSTVGRPRRHAPRQDFFLDRFSPWPRFGVGR